jgi:hypothetical protein
MSKIGDAVGHFHRGAKLHRVREAGRLPVRNERGERGDCCRGYGGLPENRGGDRSARRVPAAATARIEPWAELGQTEKRIAEAERVLPCSARLACQWTTCRKAGAFRYRRLVHGHLEATR